MPHKHRSVYHRPASNIIQPITHRYDDDLDHHHHALASSRQGRVRPTNQSGERKQGSRRSIKKTEKEEKHRSHSRPFHHDVSDHQRPHRGQQVTRSRSNAPRRGKRSQLNDREETTTTTTTSAHNHQVENGAGRRAISSRSPYSAYSSMATSLENLIGLDDADFTCIANQPLGLNNDYGDGDVISLDNNRHQGRPDRPQLTSPSPTFSNRSQFKSACLKALAGLIMCPHTVLPILVGLFYRSGPVGEPNSKEQAYLHQLSENLTMLTEARSGQAFPSRLRRRLALRYGLLLLLLIQFLAYIVGLLFGWQVGIAVAFTAQLFCGFAFECGKNKRRNKYRTCCCLPIWVWLTLFLVSGLSLATLLTINKHAFYADNNNKEEVDRNRIWRSCAITLITTCGVTLLLLIIAALPTLFRLSRRRFNPTAAADRLKPTQLQGHSQGHNHYCMDQIVDGGRGCEDVAANCLMPINNAGKYSGKWQRLGDIEDGLNVKTRGGNETFGCINGRSPNHYHELISPTHRARSSASIASAAASATISAADRHWRSPKRRLPTETLTNNNNMPGNNADSSGSEQSVNYRNSDSSSDDTSTKDGDDGNEDSPQDSDPLFDFAHSSTPTNLFLGTQRQRSKFDEARRDRRQQRASRKAEKTARVRAVRQLSQWQEAVRDILLELCKILSMLDSRSECRQTRIIVCVTSSSSDEQNSVACGESDLLKLATLVHLIDRLLMRPPLGGKSSDVAVLLKPVSDHVKKSPPPTGLDRPKAWTQNVVVLISSPIIEYQRSPQSVTNTPTLFRSSAPQATSIGRPASGRRSKSYQDLSRRRSDCCLTTPSSFPWTRFKVWWSIHHLCHLPIYLENEQPGCRIAVQKPGTKISTLYPEKNGLPKKKLSCMTIDDVCGLVRDIIGIYNNNTSTIGEESLGSVLTSDDSERPVNDLHPPSRLKANAKQTTDAAKLNHYEKQFRQLNLNGAVLSVCPIQTLREQLDMSFGDWQLFSVLVLYLRHLETNNIDQSTSLPKSPKIVQTSFRLNSRHLSGSNIGTYSENSIPLTVESAPPPVQARSFEMLRQNTNSLSALDQRNLELQSTGRQMNGGFDQTNPPYRCHHNQQPSQPPREHAMNDYGAADYARCLSQPNKSMWNSQPPMMLPHLQTSANFPTELIRRYYLMKQEISESQSTTTGPFADPRNDHMDVVFQSRYHQQSSSNLAPNYPNTPIPHNTTGFREQEVKDSESTSIAGDLIDEVAENSDLQPPQTGGLAVTTPTNNAVTTAPDASHGSKSSDDVCDCHYWYSIEASLNDIGARHSNHLPPTPTSPSTNSYPNITNSTQGVNRAIDMVMNSTDSLSSTISGRSSSTQSQFDMTSGTSSAKSSISHSSIEGLEKLT